MLNWTPIWLKLINKNKEAWTVLHPMHASMEGNSFSASSSQCMMLWQNAYAYFTWIITICIKIAADCCHAKSVTAQAHRGWIAFCLWFYSVLLDTNVMWRICSWWWRFTMPSLAYVISFEISFLGKNRIHEWGIKNTLQNVYRFKMKYRTKQCLRWPVFSLECISSEDLKHPFQRNCKMSQKILMRNGFASINASDKHFTETISCAGTVQEI